MGLPIFESLDRMFPGKVEGIGFSQASKETMATKAKRRMQERRCRLPNDPEIWQSFRSARKSVTSVGQIRLAVSRSEKSDHADRWWAFCLAEVAFAEQPVFGIIKCGQHGVLARPQQVSFPRRQTLGLVQVKLSCRAF
jgi:phage FluMu gp28-like protein